MAGSPLGSTGSVWRPTRILDQAVPMVLQKADVMFPLRPVGWARTESRSVPQAQPCRTPARGDKPCDDRVRAARCRPSLRHKERRKKKRVRRELNDTHLAVRTDTANGKAPWPEQIPVLWIQAVFAVKGLHDSRGGIEAGG